MSPSFCLADLHILEIWMFHLRSIVIVMPKYLADSMMVTGVPLIVNGTWGLVQLLESPGESFLMD